MNRSLFPVQYSEPFDAFWKAYGPVPNSSKSDAYRAWCQTKSSRPDDALMLVCVDLANTWLFEETRRRNGRGKAPKPHAATWIRQKRWETWIDQAQNITTGTEKPVQRSSFKATDYFTPDRTSPLKSRQQILDEHKARQQGT